MIGRETLLRGPASRQWREGCAASEGAAVWVRRISKPRRRERMRPAANRRTSTTKTRFGRDICCTGGHHRPRRKRTRLRGGCVAAQDYIYMYDSCATQIGSSPNTALRTSEKEAARGE